VIISYYWFGLVGGYKSVNETFVSWVTIQPSHRYKLLCAWKLHKVFKYMSMFPSYVSHVHTQIWWYHALDSVLLVVTKQSIRDTCLESRFDPHIDTNYCVHANFIKCLNISLCLPYMRHIFIFKLDDAMPIFWSSWWLQISLWEAFVSSHDSAPT
jgi:hypothetical protein